MPQVESLITSAGGEIEAVREGLRDCSALSTLSYNHPTWWMMRSAPGKWVHIEAVGDVLVDRYAEALQALPESTIHFEAGHREPFVLVNGLYESPEQVGRAIDHLRSLGAKVHDPHQWWVDRGVERIRELSERNDPRGLFNPGKLRSSSSVG